MQTSERFSQYEGLNCWTVFTVDGAISRNVSAFLEMTLTMLMKLTAVVILSPIFFFPVIGVALLGILCGRLYVKVQLCVKREMSNARSPVLGHFGAAIAGIVSIRAYQAQDAFKKEVRLNCLTPTWNSPWAVVTKPDRPVLQTFQELLRLKQMGWCSHRFSWSFFFCDFGCIPCSSVEAWTTWWSRKGRVLAQYGRYDSRSTAFFVAYQILSVGFSSIMLYWVRTVNALEVNGA